MLEPMRSRDMFPALEEGGEGDPPRTERGHFDASPENADHPLDQSGGLTGAAADRLDAVRHRIAALLGPSPIGLDDLARAADASAREIRVALMELELAGRVEYSGGDRVAARIAGEAG